MIQLVGNGMEETIQRLGMPDNKYICDGDIENVEVWEYQKSKVSSVFKDYSDVKYFIFFTV